jgi:hypothetical protein
MKRGEGRRKKTRRISENAQTSAVEREAKHQDRMQIMNILGSRSEISKKVWVKEADSFGKK